MGGGWLFFGLPAAEMAVHTSDEDHRLQHAGHRLLGAVLYLMCEDLQLLIKTLREEGVSCTEVEEEVEVSSFTSRHFDEFRQLAVLKLREQPDGKLWEW